MRQLNDFASYDDVFSPPFVSDILVLALISRSAVKLSKLKADLRQSQPLGMASWPLKEIRLLSRSSQTIVVNSGPYYLVDGYLYRVRKLYPDIQSAFQVAMIPGESKYRYVHFPSAGFI